MALLLSPHFHACVKSVILTHSCYRPNQCAFLHETSRNTPQCAHSQSSLEMASIFHSFMKVPRAAGCWEVQKTHNYRMTWIGRNHLVPIPPQMHISYCPDSPNHQKQPQRKVEIFLKAQDAHPQPMGAAPV